MNKLEYIAKTLSRTTRKDYENYVLNRLWARLDDLEIKPVSQQYVKRDSGYALIDLYFPQLNIGIECDEMQHANSIPEDEMRFVDIMSAIGGDYRQIRIPIFEIVDGEPVFRPIKELNSDIDAAVDKIRAAKLACADFEAWTLSDSDLEKAKAKGYISADDGFCYKNTAEIRDLLSLSKVAYQRSFYSVSTYDNDDHLWLPFLAIENSGFVKPGSWAGHINFWDSEKRIIYEYVKYGKEVSKREAREKDAQAEDFKRIVFAKSRDNLGFSCYKFLGLFKKTGEVVERDVNGEKLLFRIHRLVAEELVLPTLLR